MTIRKIGISLKPDQPQLGGLVHEIEKWLRDRGIEVLLGEEAAKASGLPGMPRSEVAGKVDLMVVLGGDGMLLAVARAIGERAVPVLGVNLGTLGYLAELSLDELFPTLEAVHAGRLQTETRMRLDVHAERDGREIGAVESDYTRLRVVALKRSGAELAILPNATDTIASDDRLVVCGQDESLLAAAVAARRPESDTNA